MGCMLAENQNILFLCLFSLKAGAMTSAREVPAGLGVKEKSKDWNPVGNDFTPYVCCLQHLSHTERCMRCYSSHTVDLLSLPSSPLVGGRVTQCCHTYPKWWLQSQGSGVRMVFLSPLGFFPLSLLFNAVTEQWIEKCRSFITLRTW